MLILKIFWILVSFIFICFAFGEIIKNVLLYRKESIKLNEYYDRENKKISDYYANLREEVANQVKIYK